jgi:pyruvate dehydrogenase E1 component subunit alpha
MNRPGSPAAASATAAHHSELLREMLLIRRFEEKCVQLYSGS